MTLEPFFMEKRHMEERLIRLPEIVGNKKEGIPGLLPIGASTLWKAVKEKRFPQPVKLGPRTTCWKLSEIMQLVNKGGADNGR
jgi:prophage regulatory protein